MQRRSLRELLSQVVVACIHHVVELSDGFPNSAFTSAEAQDGAPVCRAAFLTSLSVIGSFHLLSASLGESR